MPIKPSPQENIPPGIIQPTTIKGITQIPQPGNTNIQKNPLGLEIDKLKQDQQEKIRKLKEQQPASKEPAQRQGHTQQDIHDNKIDDDSETVPGEKIGKKDKITE
jgi:hypothetical protein